MSEIIDLHMFGLFVESQSFDLKSISLSSTGALSGQPLNAGPVAQRWIASVTSAEQDQTEWRPFRGLIASLRGRVGLTRCFDPACRRPLFDVLAAKTQTQWSDATDWSDGTGWSSGCLPPNVAIDAAAARGARSVVMREFPASTEKVLRHGDLFEIRPGGVSAEHGHLYIVTGVANSDASGKTRVAFEPGLRTGVAAGDTVSLREPSTVFSLATDEAGDVNVRAPNIGRFGLPLIEVLPRN